MPKQKGSALIYQFPLPLDSPESASETPLVVGLPGDSASAINLSSEKPLTEVVISGSFRKDNEGLKRAYEELLDLGCHILSPANVRVATETDGFVFMEGEERQLPEDIEIRHLNAIQEAQFVWLHAPSGYVGTSAALEVGFAHAVGIPVYSSTQVSDPVLGSFVRRALSPRDVVNAVLSQDSRVIPNPLVHAFQKYYSRAAVQRGYAKESARDTLLLMVEEVGELARAIRKREKLQRHGQAIREDPSLELADVFIYVVHMANVLGINLSDVVRQKELLNIEKIVRHSAAK